MIQRKCPECQEGVMSELDSFFGWGRDSTYICDKCGDTVNIYESNTIVPYLIFIVIELVVFMLDSNIGMIGYLIYLALFLFFTYMGYKMYTQNQLINSQYKVIGEVDTIELTDIQKEKLNTIQLSNKRTAKKIYISIAIFLVLSYFVILTTSIEESTKGYFFIGIFLLMIPLVLWIKKR